MECTRRADKQSAQSISTIVKVGFFLSPCCFGILMCFPLQECQIQKFKGEIENMEEKKCR